MYTGTYTYSLIADRLEHLCFNFERYSMMTAFYTLIFTAMLE
jgi:hypothetical protein